MTQSNAHELDLLIEQVTAMAEGKNSEGPVTVSVPPWEINRFQPIRFGPIMSKSTGTGLHLDDLLFKDGQDFVANTYRLLLGREPDEQGVAAYTEAMRHDQTKLGVVLDILSSEEARKRGAGVTGAGIAMKLFQFRQIFRKLGAVGKPFHRLLLTISGAYERNVEHRSKQHHHILTLFDSTQSAVSRQFRSWIHPLDNMSAQLFRIDMEIDRIKAGMKEGAGAQAPDSAPTLREASAWESSQEELDKYYLAFEEANRGDRQDILQKLAIYVPWLDRHVERGLGPVIDLGCGRGEWMVLLRSKGIVSVGIDSNALMIADCRQQGLNVEFTDAVGFLKGLDEGSIGAVSAFHLIEHLPFAKLHALVKECYRVLQPGGWILFETPNPENVLVGSHTFYSDFTHRNPVTPTALQFLAAHHGFRELEIVRSNPYPPEARVPGNDPLTERVNGHLCGPQDFALIARK